MLPSISAVRPTVARSRTRARSGPPPPTWPSTVSVSTRTSARWRSAAPRRSTRICRSSARPGTSGRITKSVMPSASRAPPAVRADTTRRVVAAAGLLPGECQETFPRGHGGEVLAALRVGAAEQDRVRAEEDGRQHRLRHEAAPELLHDDHQVPVAEPEAAVLLGQDDARPAEPRHLAPELAREAVRVGRVAQRADALQGRAPRDELACGVLEELLLFREDEVHQSGSPSTRLAMMLSWTSEVPPSIELPRERSQSRVTLSSSSAKPGPSQPSACGPRVSTISSRRRWFSSVP